MVIFILFYIPKISKNINSSLSLLLEVVPWTVDQVTQSLQLRTTVVPDHLRYHSLTSLKLLNLYLAFHVRCQFQLKVSLTQLVNQCPYFPLALNLIFDRVFLFYQTNGNITRTYLPFIPVHNRILSLRQSLALQQSLNQKFMHERSPKFLKLVDNFSLYMLTEYLKLFFSLKLKFKPL